MLRIISLVPSITETLIECDVNVVGRTRFCIHPVTKINKIPSVAGTKDINWKKIKALKPDLVILDKEENTLEMAESCPYPYIALHITGVNNISLELLKLAERIESQNLKLIAKRWEKITEKPNKILSENSVIPAIISELENQSINWKTVKHINYMIWKDPWMAIGPNTFIFSMLEKLGFAKYLIKREGKYPNLGDLLTPNDNTFYLFSSEPFPFERYQNELVNAGFKGAVINGESYSWYGTRSLIFLENELN